MTSSNVRLVEMKARDRRCERRPASNANGLVIVLSSLGALASNGVDVAHLVRSDPSQLCFGVCRWPESTICAEWEAQDRAARSETDRPSSVTAS